MPQMNIPRGSGIALKSDDWSLSFDELHRLRFRIRTALWEHLDARPLRVIGCLRDDEKSLLALLFITELFDYMPINPNLSDVEIERIAEQSGADAVVLSQEFLRDKRQLFNLPTIINWDDLVATALLNLASDTDTANKVASPTNGRLILHTSGSTGLPKRVPISIASINSSAKNIAAGHQLTADDHALNALPTFHIGGLVDVLLAPLSVGGAVSITDKRNPADLAVEIVKRRPSWVQIVPTILRRMVEDLDPAVIRDAGASLKFIRSISAPVPPDLKRTAEDLFGCPIIEMYGMTETAGQIATNTRDQGANKPGSVGKPVGVMVAILDGFGNRVKTGKVGEVCVKGACVFDGYEGMAKSDVFFEDWFRTGDLGVLDDDGHLFLRGRLKEMINVGGEKISPHEIETAALLMPEVIEAASYALPHPTLGEQVGLTIATRGTIDPVLVKQFLGTRLADFKRPSLITVLDQLPRLANAKIDRVLLKREATDAWAKRNKVTPNQTSKHLTPETKAVATHWARILKCRVPDGQDDFFDMGGDSLSATQLLLLLEATLKRSISPSQLFESPTFAGLVAALSDKNATHDQDEAPALRFVRQTMAGWPGRVEVSGGLLHGIGGLKSGAPLFWSSQGSSEIQAIADTFGQKRPLYFCSSLYKLKDRQACDFSILADQLAIEIDAIQPDGPIAIGGFCGGAWVMHAAAKRLVQMGRDIRVFISFDYWPDDETPFPTLHGMSRCNANSARAQYSRHDLAYGVLHPAGAQTVEIDSVHQFKQDDILPHLAIFNDVIDGTGPAIDALTPTVAYWDMAKRRRAPDAQISILEAPRFYKKGRVNRLRINVTNTSEQIWEPTALSGLSVQIDLVNVDNNLHRGGVGFGSFDRQIEPGQSVQFTFEIPFSNKRRPFWLSCCLTSQGVTRFTSKPSGARKMLVLPSLF